jgi:hypothetical protein
MVCRWVAEGKKGRRRYVAEALAHSVDQKGFVLCGAAMCRDCVAMFLKVDRSTLYTYIAKAKAGEYPADRDPRIREPHHLREIYLHGLGQLADEYGQYLPTREERVLPYGSWKEVLGVLHKRLGYDLSTGISLSTLHRIREDPRVADITCPRKKRQAQCSACGTFQQQMKRILSSRALSDEEEKIREEYASHLFTAHAHRAKFTKHCAKAL